MNKIVWFRYDFRVADNKAFKDAVISGRNSFLAGRMTKNYLADPSSPTKGLI